MKRQQKWKAAAAFAAMLASGAVCAAPGYMGHGEEMGMAGPMGGSGHGMHGGPGMGMMMGPNTGMMSELGPVWALNLSDEQRKKVREIHSELRKKTASLRAQMEDESDKLWELYSQERRDPTAIGKVYSKIFDIQRQMIEEKIAGHNKVEDQLTKEQRQQMRQMSRQWRWNAN